MSQTVLLGTLVELKSNHVDTDTEGAINKKRFILTWCLNKRSFGPNLFCFLWGAAMHDNATNDRLVFLKCSYFFTIISSVSK